MEGGAPELDSLWSELPGCLRTLSITVVQPGPTGGRTHMLEVHHTGLQVLHLMAHDPLACPRIQCPKLVELFLGNVTVDDLSTVALLTKLSFHDMAFTGFFPHLPVGEYMASLTSLSNLHELVGADIARCTIPALRLPSLTQLTISRGENWLDDIHSLVIPRPALNNTLRVLRVPGTLPHNVVHWIFHTFSHLTRLVMCELWGDSAESSWVRVPNGGLQSGGPFFDLVTMALWPPLPFSLVETTLKGFPADGSDLADFMAFLAESHSSLKKLNLQQFPALTTEDLELLSPLTSLTSLTFGAYDEARPLAHMTSLVEVVVESHECHCLTNIPPGVDTVACTPFIPSLLTHLQDLVTLTGPTQNLMVDVSPLQWCTGLRKLDLNNVEGDFMDHFHTLSCLSQLTALFIKKLGYTVWENVNSTRIPTQAMPLLVLARLTLLRVLVLDSWDYGLLSSLHPPQIFPQPASPTLGDYILGAVKNLPPQQNRVLIPSGAPVADFPL